jgi:hypothetical protein
MGRQPVALPAGDRVEVWDPRAGSFRFHPNGFSEGIRPEWDRARARYADLRAQADRRRDRRGILGAIARFLGRPQ